MIGYCERVQVGNSEGADTSATSATEGQGGTLKRQNCPALLCYALSAVLELARIILKVSTYSVQQATYRMHHRHRQHPAGRG